jgi:acyl dehydratase
VPIRTGAQAALAKTVGEIDIHAYAGISGDQQPAHVSAAFARRTPEATRIAHEGYLVALMVAAASRLMLREDGVILFAEDIDARFHRRVRLGETVSARVEVVEMLDAGAVLSAVVYTQGRVMVAEGRIRLSVRTELEGDHNAGR